MFGRKHKDRASAAAAPESQAVSQLTGRGEPDVRQALAGYQPLKSRNPGTLVLAMLIRDAVTDGRNVPAELQRWAADVIGGDRP